MSPLQATTHPMLLLQASAHRVATGPWCHITQHHHPACEPLLIGGNGGADGRDDKE